MRSEFDSYANEYESLLKDPIRDAFARDGTLFFYRQKLRVIRLFFRRQGRSMSALNWLDVGCGKGEMLRLGGAEFKTAVGCDPSAGMLAEGSEMQLVSQPDPLAIPFKDESVDFVTAVCVYHHVDPQSRARLTAAIERVLTPGGVFCIIEHNPINPITRLIVNRTPVDQYAKLVSATRARHLLEDAGFAVKACVYFLYFPEAFQRFSFLESLMARVPLGGQFAVFGQKS